MYATNPQKRKRTNQTRNWTTNTLENFLFPQKANAMDVDCLTVEERTKMMKEGKCFWCRKPRHLARDCPGGSNIQTTTTQTPTQKKWTRKDTAAHIRALISTLDKEEKDKLIEEAEGEAGLGF